METTLDTLLSLIGAKEVELVMLRKEVNNLQQGIVKLKSEQEKKE